MARSARIKEELSGLRLFFTAFFAAEGSVIAWLAQNPDRPENPMVITAWAIVLAITALLALITRQMYRFYKQLEFDK